MLTTPVQKKTPCQPLIFALVFASALLPKLTAAADFTWSQDLNHSWHYAFAMTRITIDESWFHNEWLYSQLGKVMAAEFEEVEFFAGQQATAGSDSGYSGNGIDISGATSGATAWTTGDSTQTIFARTVSGGLGSVTNNALTDYVDIEDEYSFASNYGEAKLDDWWRLNRSSQSTGQTTGEGYFELLGVPAYLNPWYVINVEVQIGRNLDTNGIPQSWETVFLAQGNSSSSGFTVSGYVWEEYMGMYSLVWEENEYQEISDGSYTFGFIMNAGEVMRVTKTITHSQDVGADDQNSNSANHELTATVSISVTDP
jgi:hypothetical protein